MGFYYFSIVSFLAASAVSAVVVGFLVTIRRRLGLNKGWLYVLIPVAIIAPWSEELWIAYNFGQLCRKDAGLFIYKTVEAEGYYYDATTPVTRLPPGSPYRFIESPDDVEKFRRVDLASTEEKQRALKWYSEEYRGKRFEKNKNEWIKYPMTDHMQVVVEIDSGYAWRVTKLDKPTARYHYKQPSIPTSVSHKVSKWEYLVIDTQTSETLARQTKYSRKSYWFFVHLSAPVLLCPVPGERPNEERAGMLYNAVLKPIAAK